MKSLQQDRAAHYAEAMKSAKRIAKMSNRFPPSAAKSKAVHQWAKSLVKAIKNGGKVAV